MLFRSMSLAPIIRRSLVAALALGLLSILVLYAAGPAPPLRDVLVAEHARTLDRLPALLDGEPLRQNVINPDVLD